MITPNDINSYAVGSIDIDLTSPAIQSNIGKSYKEVAEDAINDAQGYIESFLDRKLEVATYTDYIEGYEWEYNGARGKYTAYAQNKPIQSVTTTDVTANDFQFVSDRRQAVVEYSAGYVTLPGDIKRCMANIALYLILTQYNNLVPYQTTEKNIGGVQTNISKDAMYIERQLKQIEGYQRLQ